MEQKITQIEQIIEIYESLISNSEFRKLRDNEPEKFEEEIRKLFPTFSETNESMFKVLVKNKSTHHLKQLLSMFKNSILNGKNDEEMQKELCNYILDNRLVN